MNDSLGLAEEIVRRLKLRLVKGDELEGSTWGCATATLAFMLRNALLNEELNKAALSSGNGR